MGFGIPIPLGIPTHLGYTYPSGYYPPEGTWYQRYLPPEGPVSEIPTCENITVPQLLWWSITINYLKHTILEFESIHTVAIVVFQQGSEDGDLHRQTGSGCRKSPHLIQRLVVGVLIRVILRREKQRCVSYRHTADSNVVINCKIQSRRNLLLEVGN